MTDCIFCKIANKEIGSEMVYEDKAAVAFLDIHPIIEGHAVVIPKAHAENILEIPDDLIGPVFEAVKKTTSILNKAFKPDGFSIGINHGRFGAHTKGVDHLHIHVMPRYINDNGGSMHTLVKSEPKRTVRETKEFIIKSQ